MFCPKCGKENADGAEFCGSCGTPLKNELVPPVPGSSSVEPVRKPVKRKGRLIGIGAAIIIVILIIGISTSLFSPTEQNNSAGSSTKSVVQPKPNINFEPKSSVDSYSWEELSEISKLIGTASNDEEALNTAKKYNLLNSAGKLDGTQTKSIQLTDGQSIDVQIAGFYHDAKSSGGKAGITFIFKDAIACHAMNSTDTNSGGWERSQMRSWLASEGISMLPSDLSGVIVEVEKKTNNTGSTESVSSVTTTNDKLWLFSMTELCGFDEQLKQHSSYFEGSGAYYSSFNSETASSIKASLKIWAAEGSEYKLFKDQAVDIMSGNDILEKWYDDTSCYWWERSADPCYHDGFSRVNSSGGPYLKSFYGVDASDSLGVVPGFCI